MVTRNTFLKLLKTKQYFLYEVYAFLIVQVSLTFFIVYKFKDHPYFSEVSRQSFFLYCFTCFGIILLLTLIHMPTWLKCLLFTLYAMFFGCLLTQSTKYISRDIIDQALITTLTIFICMTLFGFILVLFNINISWMYMYIIFALLALIGSSLVLYVFNPEFYHKSYIYRTIHVISVIVFSIYILWATSNMLQDDYRDDFVSASIDLYLGFINSFIRIVNLSSD